MKGLLVRAECPRPAEAGQEAGSGREVRATPDLCAVSLASLPS
jgi:hypothetical protein